jgi:hypothetical protein
MSETAPPVINLAATRVNGLGQPTVPLKGMVEAGFVVRLVLANDFIYL